MLATTAGAAMAAAEEAAMVAVEAETAMVRTVTTTTAATAVDTTAHRREATTSTAIVASTNVAFVQKLCWPSVLCMKVTLSKQLREHEAGYNTTVPRVHAISIGRDALRGTIKGLVAVTQEAMGELIGGDVTMNANF